MAIEYRKRVIAALQALHAANIPGVYAPADTSKYPAAINKHPTVLVYPGPGTGRAVSLDADRQQDVMFTIRAFAMPIAQGVPVAGPVTSAIDLLDQLADLYLAPAQVEIEMGAGETVQAILDQEAGITDSGLAVLSYGGTDYLGCELQVRISGVYG